MISRQCKFIYAIFSAILFNSVSFILCIFLSIYLSTCPYVYLCIYLSTQLIAVDLTTKTRTLRNLAKYPVLWSHWVYPLHYLLVRIPSYPYPHVSMVRIPWYRSHLASIPCKTNRHHSHFTPPTWSLALTMIAKSVRIPKDSKPIFRRSKTRQMYFRLWQSRHLLLLYWPIPQ